MKAVLERLNAQTDAASDLPSDDIQRIIYELFDPFEFDHAQLDATKALDSLKKLVSRHGLVAFLDPMGRCYLRNIGTGVVSPAFDQQAPVLSPEEAANRKRVSDFLESASEDEFTEIVLVPFLQRLGFRRVSNLGHKEKTLEFGKDLWMKFQLPTGHWLYFGVQVKRDKIDASRDGGVNNIAQVLTQAEMALKNAIFDPDTNRTFLPDHVFIIAAGQITRAARLWINENLDASRLRQIMLMDRDELLNHSARLVLDLPEEDESDNAAEVEF